MQINWDSTSRGFKIGEFSDLYYQKCSIQESSLAGQEAIWFGAEDILWDEIYERQRPYELNGSTYKHVNGRMHLNRDMAAQLWPILKRFAEEGILEESN